MPSNNSITGGYNTGGSINCGFLSLSRRKTATLTLTSGASGDQITLATNSLARAPSGPSTAGRRPHPPSHNSSSQSPDNSTVGGVTSVASYFGASAESGLGSSNSNSISANSQSLGTCETFRSPQVDYSGGLTSALAFRLASLSLTSALFYAPNGGGDRSNMTNGDSNVATAEAIDVKSSRSGTPISLPPSQLVGGMGSLGSVASSASSVASSSGLAPGSSVASSVSSAAAAALAADVLANGARGLSHHSSKADLQPSPACPRLDDVPLLEPIVCPRASHDRLTDLVFCRDGIYMACQRGLILTWKRPPMSYMPQQQHPQIHQQQRQIVNDERYFSNGQQQTLSAPPSPKPHSNTVNLGSTRHRSHSGQAGQRENCSFLNACSLNWKCTTSRSKTSCQPYASKFTTFTTSTPLMKPNSTPPVSARHKSHSELDTERSSEEHPKVASVSLLGYTAPTHVENEMAVSGTYYHTDQHCRQPPQQHHQHQPVKHQSQSDSRASHSQQSAYTMYAHLQHQQHPSNHHQHRSSLRDPIHSNPHQSQSYQSWQQQQKSHQSLNQHHRRHHYSEHQRQPMSKQYVYNHLHHLYHHNLPLMITGCLLIPFLLTRDLQTRNCIYLSQVIGPGVNYICAHIDGPIFYWQPYLTFSLISYLFSFIYVPRLICLIFISTISPILSFRLSFWDQFMCF
ncbi:unnamed protein product [Protopolystoma xenopodis]|uniref:Uncharacterized protein n=1 Tax=Protopolystoma xenopodis TaxID=117903 RepID=A0A3S5CMG7_9PLAT|nr:unnamed protein product [Protopolystoma xenopodis]